MSSWLKNAVIYEILIDRFAGFRKETDDLKRDWAGGTIRGIIEKLPYLEELGITCISISPFFKGAAYHGYQITDLEKVDEHFGTTEDLQELVRRCHDKNIKVVIGFVPNHVAKEHHFFLDATNNKSSKYKDWFYFTHWPDKYIPFLHFPELPKIDLDNKEARNYVIENILSWHKKLNFDGLKIDHPIGPSHHFWRELKKRIQGTDLVTIGEAWLWGVSFADAHTLRVPGRWKMAAMSNWFHKSQQDIVEAKYTRLFDGTIDFTFSVLMRQFLSGNEYSENVLRKKLAKHYEKFPKEYSLLSVIDNQDMDRFLFDVRNDKKRLKKAIEIQFEIDQPKIIYQGTEIGMTQKQSIESSPHGDMEVRGKMIWDESRHDKDLFHFYQDQIKKSFL